MSADGSDLVRTVDRILAIDRETEWIEFKHNNDDPKMIGEYISALGNSAALDGLYRAYLIWGISDKDHSVVGTTVTPEEIRMGGEELKNFLTRSLQPVTYFAFHEVDYQGKRLVVLEIEPPRERPIRFLDTEYIRIGSYKKKLKDHPGEEARLWRLFDDEGFEKSPAIEHVSTDRLVDLIDYPAYFAMRGQPLPENRSQIIETLAGEGFFSFDTAAGWSVTNLGALLFAKDLRKFPTLARKAPRVVHYEGNSRIKTLREMEGRKGYAAGISGLYDYVLELVPSSEEIRGAIRSSDPLYPEIALRELIANALIHQDLRINGTGPTIEVFADRIEITNPGTPLIDPIRFIDSPPQSRNERLARSMRQMGVCEERGSGWDKVAFAVEFNQLPPPLVEVTENHTRVVLFAPRPLAQMDKTDRIRAVYQHACLQYVNRENMTNSTVRKRFGISDKNSAQASRMIKDALEAELITPYDPTVGAKAMRYVPFWADPARSSIA